MKTDIDNTFIRYGRLHLTKQEGYSKDFHSDSFHAPPAPYGFYAMPIRFQELFLVGSLEKTQPDVFSIPKKLNRENNPIDFDWNEYEKVRKNRYKKNIHKFVVKNEDVIWHHLDIKPNMILASYGSWYKSSVRDWKSALIKESVKLRAEGVAGFCGERINLLAEIPKKAGFYSKDHFEVFFDTKVY